MAAPGFSVSELVLAINKCRDIVSAFTDEFASAPARVQELVETVKYLRTVLQYLEDIHGDIYPHKSAFLDRLRECEKFIKKYKSLQQRSSKSGSETSLADKLRRPLDTAWFGLEGEKRAVALNNALSLQIQNLVVFFVVLGL